tara:strand:+ start:153 stop:464 length:312 start_codon:yes stop_codon:yes gene_type:complete
MIIYVDIDDTICTNTDKYLDYSKSLPIRNRIKRINELFDQGHTIIYWTARGTRTGINWFNVTHRQLKLWGCKFHELRMNKPAYDLFIDDKNINSDTYFNDKVN